MDGRRTAAARSGPVSTYILDASVAAKWFLPSAAETYVEQAVRILEGYASGRIQLLVPDLFWSEAGNIFWTAARLGRMSRKSAKEATASLLAQHIPTSPSFPLLQPAFDIATSFNRTVYDAVYVALAVSHNRTLLTADERLATSLSAYFPVRWLGSL